MKRFLTVTVAALLAATFSSCSSDEDNEDLIYDLVPINFYVTVSDSNGNDLLNPDTPNSLADIGITIEVDGKTYCKDSLATTRAYFARFYGAISNVDDKGTHYLEIGEFAGDADCENKMIVIDWNDGGKKDTLAYSNSVTWKNHEPQITRHYYLNNKETTSPWINFVKSVSTKQN